MNWFLERAPHLGQITLLTAHSHHPPASEYSNSNARMSAALILSLAARLRRRRARMTSSRPPSDRLPRRASPRLLQSVTVSVDPSGREQQQKSPSPSLRAPRPQHDTELTAADHVRA